MYDVIKGFQPRCDVMPGLLTNSAEFLTLDNRNPCASAHYSRSWFRNSQFLYMSLTIPVLICYKTADWIPRLISPYPSPHKDSSAERNAVPREAKQVNISRLEGTMKNSGSSSQASNRTLWKVTADFQSDRRL